MKIFKITFDLNWRIQQYRQYSLSGTSIVNNLSSKKEIIIIHSQGFFFFNIFSPLEQKNKAIDVRLNFGYKFVIIHTINFFNLNRRGTNFLYKLCKNSWIGFNSAPLIEHLINIQILYIHMIFILKSIIYFLFYLLSQQQYFLIKLSSTMSQIYVGTGFNQVIHLTFEDKGKNKTFYGQMNRNPVRQIFYDYEQHRIFYANQNKIFFSYTDDTDTHEIVSTGATQKIISINYDIQSEKTTYCLSNGSIRQLYSLDITDQTGQPNYLFKSKCLTQNNFKFATPNQTKSFYLLVGKCLPTIVDIGEGSLLWKAKNMKHDELDLAIPVDDVDASYLSGDKNFAILSSKRKIRIYDIRGTNKRPSIDIELNFTSKSNMTKMKISNCQNYYYFSNDIGQIIQTDSRKNFGMIGKFKGITTSVTDMQISSQHLLSCSLDGYVRLFDIQSKKLQLKIYLNKPLYSMLALFSNYSEQFSFEEPLQCIDQVNEEVKKPAKVKQIRKRNKIGLKYLEPQQFDDVEIKKQQEVQQKWESKLNPIDRAQFE